MNLALAFEASVRRNPVKTALFWGETEVTYQALFDQARFAAQILRVENTVCAGERIGLWLKNCPEFVSSFFGILQAGAVVVPINNFLKPEEVKYILRDAGVDVLITDAELGVHEPELQAARPNLRVIRIEMFSANPAGSQGGATEPAGMASSVSVEPRTEKDLAVLIYTSGTTGHPKGVMLSHGNLLHNVESCRIVLETVDGDRIAAILPLFHSYMLTVGMLLPLLVGGSMVLVKSLHPAKSLLHEVMHRQVTILPAIPQFYRSMVQLPFSAKLPLRLFISGAAPLPVQVLKEFEEKFHTPLIEGYGLSEASPVVAKNPINGLRKPGSIGLPVAHVEVSVQDDEGNLLGPNERGEICVRGGNVMVGYWNKPAETADVLRHGWLLTGDVGYHDEDGYYYITDRKKDMLLVNGINVYPREIEEVLYQCPGVKEAAVIGKPDPRKGEQPVAFIAPIDGAEIKDTDLKAYLKEKLADYKVPKKYIFMSALPRNATGKILKTSLRHLPVPD